MRDEQQQHCRDCRRLSYNRDTAMTPAGPLALSQRCRRQAGPELCRWARLAVNPTGRHSPPTTLALSRHGLAARRTSPCRLTTRARPAFFHRRRRSCSPALSRTAPRAPPSHRPSLRLSVCPSVVLPERRLNPLAQQAGSMTTDHALQTRWT